MCNLNQLLIDKTNLIGTNQLLILTYNIIVGLMYQLTEFSVLCYNIK